MSVSAIVFLVVVVGSVVYVIGVYNRLVLLRNRFKNAFAQIEVQLKRRHDLIPNLVETAKAYLAHERDTLESVISARNQAVAGLKAASGQPGDEQRMAQLGSAEGALTNAMGRLNVTMEAYPDLKASQNMQQLSEELTSTENKVAFARQAYNDAVMEYNTYKQSFPPVFFAANFGHKADAGVLEFADTAQIQAVPKVAF
ncbi:LemA family protein [Pseudomonas sp. SLFW]|uniref:LemA family protein n=1 Tax=Pseudomonas sp. SLFW TaxID=2683259 RepID=UPI0014129A21|nr:LemA family protein [Pseudomonas sp. SLFW]NBB09243.1 LemA family protein [Pseudomonas sp. SLFW]